MKKILISASILLSSLPAIALAANTVKLGYLDSLITGATGLTKNLLVFLISLAVVWFIWNVIKYTMSSDEEAKGKAKSQMIWGVIAIAVIVSIWRCSRLRHAERDALISDIDNDVNVAYVFLQSGHWFL